MTRAAELLDRIGRHLVGLGAARPPERARRAGVLVLLRPVDGPDGSPDGDLELILTRRRDDLRNHPGQISFPGGRVEDGESIEDAAVREAREEIDLDPGSVTVLGRLAPFYLAVSKFWLVPVVAVWNDAHALTAEPREVAELIRTRVSVLTDPARLRVVELSSVGRSWAWQLDDTHLLWGATGRVTAEVLDALVPGWAPPGGPDALPDDRVAEPWRDLQRVPRRRFADLPVRRPDELGPTVTDPVRWARAAAGVAARLVPEGATVLVLVGAGGCGRLAVRLADELGSRHRVERAEVARAGETVRALRSAGGPDPTLVVDGLVGRGLDGPLRGGALELAHAIRTFTPRLLAVDVPSGLHPERGVVGEIVAADATVAFGRPAPALGAVGMAAFAGDVVAVPAARRNGAPDTTVADAPVVVAEPVEAGWRE